MYFGEEIESKGTYYIEGWEGKPQLNLVSQQFNNRVKDFRR